MFRVSPFEFRSRPGWDWQSSAKKLRRSYYSSVCQHFRGNPPNLDEVRMYAV